MSLKNSSIIFYDEPIEIPDESNYHLLIYVYYQMGIGVLAQLLFALLVIVAYNKKPFSIRSILILLISYESFKICFNLYYLFVYNKRNPDFYPVYYLDIILSSGFLIISIALLAVFDHNLKIKYLYLFVIIHFVLMILRFILGQLLSPPYLPGSIYFILESLQFFYIAIKLENPDKHSNWTWVLLFYYIITITLFVIAVILMVFLVVFLFSIIFDSKLFREISALSKFLIFGLIFYFTWTGFGFYYIVSGFDLLLESNAISIKKKGVSPDPRLLYTAWFILVCSFITILLMGLAYYYLKDALLNFVNKEKIKEISLQSLIKNLKLDVEKTDSYFTNPIPNLTQHLKRNDSQENIPLCIICKAHKPDVLFHPCKHGRICQYCLKQYLRERDRCPTCREKIEKAYLIFFDENKQRFMSKGFMKVKQERKKNSN